MSNAPHKRFETVAAALTKSSGAGTGKMFGMPTLTVDGKAFAGLFKDSMVFKLGSTDHTRALALRGARLFDPSGHGRPMKQWVEVPPQHATRWSRLARQAIAYVSQQR